MQKLLKNPILLFRKNQVSLSQIDNGESKNYGAETSGPTLETPGCKNYCKNQILWFRTIRVALSQIDNGESKNHVAETSGLPFRHQDAKIIEKKTIL